MKTKTPFLINSISRSPLRLGLLLIALPLAVGSFALSPTAQALDPAPDGGYPNNNTAEGDQTLNSLTTGFDNTANGSQALFSNTSGSNNTANGVGALSNNTSGSDNTANGASALLFSTTGKHNIALGDSAGANLTAGDNCSVLRFKAFQHLKVR